MRAGIDRWMSALLGHEPRQRSELRNTLSASVVYAVCGVAQWFWVSTGHVPFNHAHMLVGLMLCSQILFYIAIRSGWSRRFADTALTKAQMVCAILSLSAGYLINPQVRGVLLMMVAMVLTFGAFSLSPRRCRQLGWFALAVFALTMGIGASTRPDEFPPVIELITFVFTAVTLPLIGHLAGQLSQMRHDLRVQRRELSDALKRVNVLATRDELTGLPNRRHMRERVEHEVQRTRRGHGSLCICVMDLDHFKTVNDQLGHAAGDAVLVNFALQSQAILREIDVLARWGGEEFLLMCPDTSIDQALQVVERVRQHLHRPESWAQCSVERVTFSAGLAVHEPAASFEQTLALADSALYKAKRQGRDRCYVA
jgi:diguanylate cyclase (GGDEF)-like protein